MSRTELLEHRYADDCALVADSLDSLQLFLSHTSAFYQKLGLSINVSKTELMEYLPTAQQLHSELHTDGSQLKKVNTFKYLGSHISANGHIVLVYR